MPAGDQLRNTAQTLRKAIDEKKRFVVDTQSKINIHRGEINALEQNVRDTGNEIASMEQQASDLERQASETDVLEKQANRIQP